MNYTKNINAHELSIEETYKKLNSHKEGLTNEEAEERIKSAGRNVIKGKNKKACLFC